MRAVSATARGEVVFAPAAAALLMRRVRSAAAAVLSPRELEVLRFDAGGATNRDVAKGLFITEATVKSHLRGLFVPREQRFSP
ncbi:LuxR C-terminal-related transcriptional regulator [Lentzea albidocapillata]|uniref:Regulatory protein, luxR family n=1 Tax=Lentzea albidocapillata TaxID=40571 RepID=A0A1W2CSB0_9PSEU|nr:LuxR C-terminal-related transcriptional regulator [Lentzea albidocapillata]SMC87846.1 regulatory protein, luxR family [Lentzea albidocapillata]